MVRATRTLETAFLKLASQESFFESFLKRTFCLGCCKGWIWWVWNLVNRLKAWWSNTTVYWNLWKTNRVADLLSNAQPRDIHARDPNPDLILQNGQRRFGWIVDAKGEYIFSFVSGLTLRRGPHLCPLRKLGWRGWSDRFGFVVLPRAAPYLAVYSGSTIVGE